MTFADRLQQRLLRSRRTVLCVAFLAGLAVALAADGGDPPVGIGLAQAQEPVRIRIAAETAGEDKSAPAAAAPATPAAPAESAPSRRPSVDAEISIGEGGVTIRKGGRRGSDDPDVVVGDMEFDSFEQFVEQAPWLAALVFGVTALVFLTPVLIIALIIWYKMRTNRQRNETMLKLAERGVVPPADAIAAVGAGAATLDAVPSTAPLYEQARQVRKRAAWSDLRKGIVMIGIGLGLVFWSMLDDGEPNGFGLVLLFVGIGYLVLWHFESRQLAGRRDDMNPTPGGR